MRTELCQPPECVGKRVPEQSPVSNAGPQVVRDMTKMYLFHLVSMHHLLQGEFITCHSKPEILDHI